jgi:D-3-phosphoglycerate dehydrogenase / 2-oxoglutarate reductase
MSVQVLITDSLHPICFEMLADAGFAVVDGSKWTRAEILKSCPEVQGWIIRSGTTIDAEFLNAAKSLVAIGRAGVGVDNVDIPTATKKGVLVLNAPEGNTISTAEHTVAMLLAMTRKIPPAAASLLSGKWDRKPFTGGELYGKTIGIAGIGKIGKAVAERCQAFSMTVIGYDPMLTLEAASKMGVELVELDEMYRRSDFITVHTPLIPATTGLLNDETIAKCKVGVGIINCARGGIVDEDALLRALESGHVGAAALDVYSTEPPTEALFRLIRHPNVVATPHIAASTEEAQENVAIQVTEQVINALSGEVVLTAVNALAVRMSAQPEVKPFLLLAERLGSAAHQIFQHPVDRLLIRCHGDVPRRYKDVLKVVALKGLLAANWKEPVNLVNAEVIAHESGLVVDVETFQSEHSFSNLIELRLQGQGHSMSVSGTIFSGEDGRITSVDEYDVEIKTQGQSLLYRNTDKPGMLAKVGQILASNEINIGSLSLGRSRPGEEALTAITVDQVISDEILVQVANIEGVNRVCMLEFMP